VITVLPHNLLRTNPCIRHNFSTEVFRKRVAQLHYVGPELRYISWPLQQMKEWSDRSKNSQHRHYMDLSVQLDAPAVSFVSKMRILINT